MLFGLVGWLLKVVGPFLWATCCACNYPFSLISSVGIRSIVVLCCAVLLLLLLVPCDAVYPVRYVAIAMCTTCIC
jgi:hypothetical protein